MVVKPSFTLAAGIGPRFTYLKDVVAFSDIQEPKRVEPREKSSLWATASSPRNTAGMTTRASTWLEKIALVMVNDPPATAEEPELFAGRAHVLRAVDIQVRGSGSAGAADAILIHTDESATYPWQVVQSAWSGNTVILGSRCAAPRIEGVGDRSGGTGNRQARRQGPRRLAESGRARCDANTVRDRAIATIDQTVAKRSSPNVIGVLRGTNPSQAVIYTAHYDHLGVRDPQPGDAPDADRSTTAPSTMHRAWLERSR